MNDAVCCLELSQGEQARVDECLTCRGHRSGGGGVKVLDVVAERTRLDAVHVVAGDGSGCQIAGLTVAVQVGAEDFSSIAGRVVQCKAGGRSGEEVPDDTELRTVFEGAGAAEAKLMFVVEAGAADLLVPGERVEELIGAAVGGSP